jgi:hypothetical protein
VQALVQGAVGLADIHEAVFTSRSYPVETGLAGDLIKGAFIGAERDPRGPGKRAPVVEEIRDIFGAGGEEMGLNGIYGN